MTGTWWNCALVRRSFVGFSAMFDWNDEELTNIIWGEGGESDDHIVPHPDQSQENPPGPYGDHINKEWIHEIANVKPAELKKPDAKADSHGSKLEGNSQNRTNTGFRTTGFRLDLWPDLCLSNIAKTERDSMRTEASNNLTGISEYDSSKGEETARLENGSEIFQSWQEDKEEGDFVDYGWANIGSFDDLDRIFSNEEPIFGHASLSNADELWSASKDVTNSPEKSISLSMQSPSLRLGELRSTSEHFEVKTENVLHQGQSFTAGYARNDISCHALHRVESSMDPIACVGEKSKLLVKGKTASEMVGKVPEFGPNRDVETFATPNEFAGKVNRHKKLVKSRKKLGERNGARQLCGVWPPSGNQCQQFDGHYAPPVGQPFSLPVLNQERQCQGSESLEYKHFFSPFFAPSVHDNIANHYPTLSVLPQFHSDEGNNQLVPSGYEVSPGSSNPLNESPDAPVKPLTMTPQEKVEKLRRRQQLRAMFAIQNQQQRLSHQVSWTEQSVDQKCSHDNQIQPMPGLNIERGDNMSTLPSLDPNSPIEQDDSNTVSMAIDDSSMDSTIYRLQDISAKLDIRLRLCIRDSLFRLAQSAMQRQYASDTSSTSKSSRDAALTKEEINSHSRIPDMETQTNPIDRTVAHLLFHRPPLEFPGKQLGTTESPLSTKFPFERKASDLISFPMGFLPGSSENKQALSHQGSKTPCLFTEGDQAKSILPVNISENASNNEAADGGAIDVEASQ